MSDQSRVVITGMGVITPLGNDLETLWNRLMQGESGVQEIQSLPADGLPTHVAAEAREFTGDIENYGELDKIAKRGIKKGTKMMCREIAMGVAAAQHALSSGGLSKEDREAVDHIMETVDKLTDRIHTLETLLDSDYPDWRQQQERREHYNTENDRSH